MGYLKSKLIISIALTLFIIGSCSQNVEAQISEDVFINRGETVRITATLLENITFGNPVPNQILYFFDQTEDALIGVSLTDSNGVAEIDWQIPMNHTLGLTLLNITFNGNETLFLAPSCQYFYPVVMSKTEMHIQIMNDQLTPDDFLEVRISLTNDELFPIKNGTVSMYKNEFLIAKATTNTSGQAVFSVKCNETWCSEGENSITLLYEKNLIHYNSEVTETIEFNFQKISTHLSVHNLPTSVMLSEIYEINLELSAEISSLSNSQIIFNLNDLYFDTLQIDETGIGKYNLSIDSRFNLGYNTITFEFPGTNRFKSAKSEFNLSVSSHAFLNLTFTSESIINENQSVMIEISDSMYRPVSNITIILHDLNSGIKVSAAIPFNITHISMSFLLTGQTGPRLLKLNITGNLYLFSSTHSYQLVVWNRAKINIIESNIQGYASPSQEIILSVLLSGVERNYSACDLIVIDSNNTIVESEITNQKGQATLSWYSPQRESNVILTISYLGNSEFYELPSNLTFSYFITKRMPINVTLCQYKISPSLQEIQVCLQFHLLNGSNPDRLMVEVTWLNSVQVLPISYEGSLMLHLKIPTIPGNYLLLYEIIETPSVLPCSGQIPIHIPEDTILASQGIGIPALLATTIISMSIAGIPIIRKWYLVG